MSGYGTLQDQLNRVELAMRELGYAVLYWQKGAKAGSVCKYFTVGSGPESRKLPQPIVVMGEASESDRNEYERVTGAPRIQPPPGTRWYRFMTD